MRRESTWSRLTMHGSFRRSRTTVERLEDRLLLSADPLVKVGAADAEQPLASTTTPTRKAPSLMRVKAWRLCLALQP